jgi:NADPH2:quinone reductase
VLVAGGAGAVGHFAIELAKWGGARVVSTVSSDEKGRLAAQAGADHVVRYTDPDAAEQIRSFAPRVDRVVEVALGTNLALDLSVCGPDSVIVTYAADGPDPVLPIRACMTANVVLRFMLLYTVPRPALVAAVQDIGEALDAGALSELPSHHFSLDDTAAAHDAVEGGAVGKVLIDLA